MASLALPAALLVLLPLSGCSASEISPKAACDKLHSSMDANRDKTPIERADLVREIADQTDDETGVMFYRLASVIGAAEDTDDLGELGAMAISSFYEVAGHCDSVGSGPWSQLLHGTTGTQDPQATDQSPQPPKSPTDIDCATATQAEWAEHCQSEPAQGETPVEGKQGETFEFEGRSTWEVTLSEVECGVHKIPDAGWSADYKRIDATPQEGNQFCILVWNLTNIGKVPAGAHATAGSLMLGDEEFAASYDDEEIARYIAETRYNVDSWDEVNPRGKTTLVSVYQIPDGESPTHVWFPDQEGAVRVALR